jgi:hypothetical protein
MKQQSAFQNLWVDITLFVGLTSLFFLDLTGAEIHQWLGIGLGGVATYHLVRHWEWIKAVSTRLFGRTSSQARLFYVLDVLLVLGFMLILLTGLGISTWLNLDLGAASGRLTNLHVIASQVTLLAAVLKIGVHAPWIIKTTRRLISSPAPAPTQRAVVLPNRLSSTPAPVAVNIQRRDFLILMGVASGAALIALSQVSPLTSRVGAATNSEINQAQTSQINSSLTGCLACRKGRSCSFPGECHDYVDNNNNGLCDRGECT